MTDITNHDHSVATDKSGHVAQNDEPTNRFELIPGGEIKTQNGQTSVALDTNKTERTFANGARIWTEVGELDGLPSFYGDPQPDLAQVRRGVNSGRFEAKAVKQKATARGPVSRDLLIEGFGVVRDQDRSNQDFENSHGMVHDFALTKEAPIFIEDLATSCTLVALSGIQNARDDEGKPVAGVGGRTFGPEPGGKNDDVAYLEVTHGARVQLTAERQDTTTPEPRPPDCSKKHTRWEVYFAGKGMGGQPNANAPAVVEADDLLFIEDIPNPCPGLAGLLPELPEKLKRQLSLDAGVNLPDRVRNRYDERVDKYLHGQRRLSDDDVRHANYDSSDDSKLSPEQRAAQATTDKRQRMWDAAKEWAKAVDVFREYVGFYLAPSEVHARAIACSGTKAAKIRVFPGEKVELDVFAAFGPQIETVLAFLEGAKRASTAIAKIVGTVVSVFAEFEYLQSPSCAIAFQYQELDKDGTRRDGSEYYAVEVAPAYSITFGFDPLLKIAFGVKCSLFDFLGVIGRLIKRGADLAKITADVGIELGIDASVSAGLTRYANGQVQPSGDGIEIKPHIEMFLVLKVREALRAEVRAGFEGSLTFGKFSQSTCGKDGCTFEASMEGRVWLHVKGVAAYDLGGLGEGEVEADWAPDEWRFPSLQEVKEGRGKKTIHLDWFA